MDNLAISAGVRERQGSETGLSPSWVRSVFLPGCRRIMPAGSATDAGAL
jgi:hypothetical protein